MSCLVSRVLRLSHWLMMSGVVSIRFSMRRDSWEIIGKLKELDAQGILVTPIEKMIL